MHRHTASLVCSDSHSIELCRCALDNTTAGTAYGSAIGVTDGLDDDDGDGNNNDDDGDVEAVTAVNVPPQISFHHQLDREIRSHMPVSDSEESDDLDVILTQIKPMDDAIAAYTPPAQVHAHTPMSDHTYPLTRRRWGRVREMAELQKNDVSDLEPESDRDLFSSQPTKRPHHSLDSDDDINDDDNGIE